MNELFASLCVRKLDVPVLNPPQQLPLFLSSSFSFDRIEEGVDIFTGKQEGYVYSRYGNPTIEAVTRRLEAMEGFGLDMDIQGYLTSSGMSAIHLILVSLLGQGDKVLTQANLYGGTTELLTRVMSGLGVETVFSNLNDLEQIESQLKSDPAIRVIYLETPTNPTLSCLDLKAITDLAHQYQIKTVVDNTFCTPYLQRPFAYGADFVIHSTTKYLNGHGTGIAGLVLGKDKSFMKDRFWTVLKLTGATCNPFDAWLVANGIRTLPLRMDRHSANASLLASSLADHSGVDLVNYPGLASHPSHSLASRQMSGFGGMLSFSVSGGQATAFRVMNQLKLASLAPTLGDVDTLVLHPATSSHLRIPKAIREEQGITDGLIRVSVGLEDATDLITDFHAALDCALVEK
ncbi:MAG: aminotransferase class I/II-fold pyridoxal phosphate-dependent enzyme [Saprospiraceae bacterium]|nr:aminotransferase class I/II-fold pyridoxal phosphate-dependent enzyme [Saprospiraceae bacterium]